MVGIYVTLKCGPSSTDIAVSILNSQNFPSLLRLYVTTFLELIIGEKFNVGGVMSVMSTQHCLIIRLKVKQHFHPLNTKHCV